MVRSRDSFPHIVKDFDEVWEFLQRKTVIDKEASRNAIAVARAIHQLTYSLIIWKFRLNKIPLQGRVFLDEIASDAVQILPQIILGYGKTGKLLIRGILDNCLRHVYFIDHVVEFYRLNNDSKWYINVEQLFDYAKAHPIFSQSERYFDALARLRGLYGDLSAAVHGRSVSDLEVRDALEKIVFEQGEASANLKLLRRCMESTNFVMSVFHKKSMQSFPKSDRSH